SKRDWSSDVCSSDLLRAAFRIGFLIFVLAALLLPFEDRASPEFVVTVLAVLIGLVFIAIVTFLARSTLPPRPRSSERNTVDKARSEERRVGKEGSVG